MVVANVPLITLLPLLSALLSGAAPSPGPKPNPQPQHVHNHIHDTSHLTPRTVLSDEQVQEWLNSRDSSLRPLTLTRRDAAGIKTRHLRPVFERDQKKPMSKRSPATPDLGGEMQFDGPPQPERDGLGNTFDAASNTEIDAQNPDNVAAPPTDAGESLSLFTIFKSQRQSSTCYFLVLTDGRSG